jgi:hypothetical protein
MKSTGLWLVRLSVVLSVYFVSTLGALLAESVAELDLNSLQTSQGLLTIDKPHRPNTPQLLWPDVLSLNGKQLLTDAFVKIESVYPSLKNPKLVSISSSSGGNCCPPTPYILDFSVNPPLIMKDFGFGPDIAESESGVVFTSGAGSKELDDDMLGVYEYRWGSGKPRLKKKTPVYSSIPLSQKQYPDEVLSDQIIREPLVELLGAKEFSQFRHSTDLGNDLKVLNDNIVIGSGCQPHNCPFKVGLFIIDINRRLAWAAEAENNNDVMSAKIWGKITPLDEL